MATLASLLARDAIVSLETIEQALQRQVLEGGELDTALLELTNVPENTLSAYRAASFDLPAVQRGELESIDPALLARVPIEVAGEHGVLPIAQQGDVLVLASAYPLAAADAQRLNELLHADVTVRIGTELRIGAALSRYYGIELGSRMRLLAERLAPHDAGELCDVRPLAPGQPMAERPPSTRPLTRPSRAGREPSAEPEGSAPVRVLPMVALGSARSAPRPLDAELDPYETRPARPSRIPLPPGSSRPPRRISGAPRGPLTHKQTTELLAKAHDRDRVLDVFFSFARQYFECTVLFSVRDERLLGMEASGLPSIADLHRVEVPIAKSGSVQGAVRMRSPRVVRLDESAADSVLVEAIARAEAQPCALIPVVIRQRVVALLYGDRSGEPIAMSELGDLIAALPSVSAAFERIIQERKLEAMKARTAPDARPSLPSGAPPEGVFGGSSSAPRVTPRGIAPQRAATVPGLTTTDAHDAPRAGAVPPPSSVEDDIVGRPTVRLRTDDIASAVRRPSAPGPAVDVPEWRPRKRKEQDITRPERPSKIAPTAARAGASVPARMPVDPPSPRTLSQPAAGTGSYAVHEASSESTGARPLARATRPSDAGRGDAGAPDASTRSARPDPRRDDRGRVEAEVVSLPAAMRQTLRPPVVEFQPASEALLVDLRAEAERLVDELCRTGPDEERPHVTALLRIGETALAVLEQRFPGPLWFDRHKLRQRMPAGRDLSAIARAMYAFEDAAVPHVAALLSSGEPEVRLCATLLSGDLVRPELMWPLYQRLFDPDGQVRLTAFEVLPLYRHVVGFDEVIKSLRQKAVMESEAVPNRLAALEAISMLRDPGSVDLLAELCGHDSRQLSVPAHRTLLAITAQDFGNVTKKWKAWIDKNRRRHRAEWLIEGLMHGEERVRAVAGTELQKLSQVYYGFVASAPKRERERAQQRYRDWWEREGRAQFGTR
jgi:hypothetical protein